MVAASKTITVEPGTDLDRLLEEATTTTLVLVKDGQRFLLHRAPEDIWEGYDPEASIRGIWAAAGSWKGLVDAEEFKAYIRERRRTKNRPSVRW
ncbi:MAG: hypothetical protein ACRDJW_18480 [Thermomicrobiales bacterium]